MDESWTKSTSAPPGRRRSSRIRPASSAARDDSSDKSARSNPRPERRAIKSVQGQTNDRGRRPRPEARHVTPPDPMDEAMKPLTDEERQNWKGWVELESDPALFNFILREYGVKNVKVQEVLGLDDEMLTFLHKPVYGLIFLFKYRDDQQEEGEGTSRCPDHVWFANQTTNNACATIALLNIVMNIPDIDLGNSMSAFKSATMPLKPAYRGQRLSTDDFIRNIHNSFARRMDMLNSDLALLNEVEKWEQARRNPKRKGTKSKAKDEEEPGFHFIAYVPIRGVVWRLDGLQRQPLNLGPCTDDWIGVARANIYQRIGQYDDDGLQFNLLSLCQSPLRTIPQSLAQTMIKISAVEKMLTIVLPDWKQFIEVNDSSLSGASDDFFGLSKVLVDNPQLPESARTRLEGAGTDPEMLMDLHRAWVRDQKDLRTSYLGELALISQENEQAARRKNDYTALIYNSIKKLAEEGLLREIVKEVRENMRMQK